MNKEQVQQQKKNRALRRVWLPLIKNLLTSASDIVGDWAFYFRVARSDYAPDLAPWLLGFSVVSSVLGAFALVSLIINNIPICAGATNIHKTRFQAVVSVLMVSEMFIEDIPQVVLTYVVLSRRLGGLNGVAVFNITTSAFNFFYNGLDLLMPLEEEHYEVVIEDVDDAKDEAFQDDSAMNYGAVGVN